MTAENKIFLCQYFTLRSTLENGLCKVINAVILSPEHTRVTKRSFSINVIHFEPNFNSRTSCTFLLKTSHCGGGGISLSPPSSLSSSLRAPPALGTNFPFHPTLFNELMAEYFKINSSNLHINYPPSLWWFFHMFLLVSMKIDSEEKRRKLRLKQKNLGTTKPIFSC